MKKILLLSAIFCYSLISAQIKSPQPSPTATITQKVGISNISVEYSRPGAKEREIFGGLVSYEKMWRTVMIGLFTWASSPQISLF